jgi:PAS domain S-box-containing protein
MRSPSVVANLAGWAKQAGEKTIQLHRLNIAPRLTLCFVFIILAMLVGNAVMLWQFHLARAQALRLNGVDQELIAVLQAHTGLMSFYERLDLLAHSENSDRLVSEVEGLRSALLQNNQRSRNALTALPANVQLDPALLPTLQAIQDALPAELGAITLLAKAKDWSAVRLRLANQVRPLESRSSALVENIDHQVSEERAQAALNIAQAQRRILLVVPMTAVLTLLVAAFLGLAITRSITQPLGRLMEGSTALARGDFGHRVPTAGSDEIARLGIVFNQMIVRLQELYRELQRRENYMAEAQKLSQTGSFGWQLSTGKIYWSDETFRIFEIERASHPTLEHVVLRTHPADRPVVKQVIDSASRDRKAFDFEHRLQMADGAVKHIHVVGHPVIPDADDVEFVGAVTDITQRKLAEQTLRESEAYLAEAQRLSQTGSWSWNKETGDMRYWSEECYRVLGFDPFGPLPRFETFFQRIHPEDQPAVGESFERALREKTDFDLYYRYRHPQRGMRDIHAVGRAVLTGSGDLVEFVGTVIDITERKRAEEALRQSEQRLRDVIETIPTMAWTALPDGSNDFANQRWLEYTGLPLKDAAGGGWGVALHPADLAAHVDKWRASLTTGDGFENEARLRRAQDGEFRWFLHRAVPLRDQQGTIVKWYGTATDIEDRKRAEQTLRKSQAYLAEAQRLSHSGSWAWNLVTRQLYWSDETFSILGVDQNTTPTSELFRERVHPDDRAMIGTVDAALVAGRDGEYNYRAILPDGSLRYIRSVAHPVKDESGQVVEFVGTVIDITEQRNAHDALKSAFEEIKVLRDQLYKENIALREEVDKASMFEEIVGESPALRSVLSRLSKIAPTDSTVLITGETGTGKELIARAIHKRSQRSSRAFVNVNCAATPPSLITSELFGHEKGAFTGALHRRLGRFELAEGGTIFLDEVGELPLETQTSLLRVLQEREFERVGGNQTIHSDVRVIAATNRDLQTAIASGTFRSDLFYRLNVIPVEIPPLRERKEDVPMLIEYFIDRFARKARKKIRTIDKATLELLQSYSWPGNIRELQNVIERSVVICEGDVLSVDQGWFSLAAPASLERSRSRLLGKLSADQEREIIEAALAETRGRISGPEGAAAQLGIPPSTLESKIRTLKINKYHFKRSSP